MNADRKRLDEISERVIGCAFTVANTLGAGFLEKVYENALAHELTKAGLMVRQQIAIVAVARPTFVNNARQDISFPNCIVFFAAHPHPPGSCFYGAFAGTTLILLNGDPLISFVLITV